MIGAQTCLQCVFAVLKQTPPRPGRPCAQKRNPCCMLQRRQACKRKPGNVDELHYKRYDQPATHTHTVHIYSPAPPPTTHVYTQYKRKHNLPGRRQLYLTHTATQARWLCC